MGKVWLLVVDGQVEEAYVSEVLARADAERWRADAGAADGQYTLTVNVQPVDVWTRSIYAGSDRHLKGLPVAIALRQAQATWGFVGAEDVYGPNAQVPYEGILAVMMEDRLMLPAFQFHHHWQPHQGLKETLRVFRDARWPDTDILLWFISPSGTTNGFEPALVLPVDPFLVIEAPAAPPRSGEPSAADR